MNSRMRSMPRKPAWPSLVWNTSGAGAPVISQYVRMARMPPTPSSNSWSSRWSDAAAVQAVGDVAQRLRVLLDVGVHQQQRHAADLRDPDVGDELQAAGHADADLGRRAVGLAEQGQRQLVGVDDRVALLLPALARQRAGGSSRAGRAVRRR